MRQKAFTLIELLIVVAIIAILAAIAVPNFLEAQVRSKVSRVKADMRTIGIGIESYRTDNNAYFQAYNQPMPDGVYVMGLGWLAVVWAEQGTGDNRPTGFHLTTPIAYLTTIPWDPFTSLYSARASINTPSWSGVMQLSSCFYGMRNNSAPLGLLVGDRKYHDIGYILNSVGPDLLLHASSYGDIWGTGQSDYGLDIGFYYGDTLYDPTNGTVSIGEIVFVGKGIGFMGR